MSYILEALRRAEQERGVAAGAVLPPRPVPDVRLWRPWPGWAIGALASLAGLVAATTVWLLVPSAPVTPAPAPVEAPAPAAVATAPPPAPVTDPLLRPAPPSPRAMSPPPAVSTRVERAPARGLSEPPARPSEPARRAVAPSPAARPRPITEGVAATAPPVVSVTPPPVAVAPPPVAIAPPLVAPERQASMAPVAGDLKTLAAKLSLQVLSWSPNPQDRFVFVSGRKYAEGQTIDDRILVERITEDGVVLSYQGERLTLKGP